MSIPVLQDLFSLKSILDITVIPMFREMGTDQFVAEVRELAPLWAVDTACPAMLTTIARMAETPTADEWIALFQEENVPLMLPPNAYVFESDWVSKARVTEAQSFWYALLARAYQSGSHAVMGVALWQYMAWYGEINWVALATYLKAVNND